ncbi:adenosine receptor A2a-like [Stylophora pistillata]|uniref:adenosine receptor A2a-like n=1 Tax=Stylophora pistillata TaxID=50429 RepID=UPI000C055C2B|nr:adenosine receptor A2a-like [Stylophora pistillata]
MESVGDVSFWVFGGFFSILTVLGNSLMMYLIISRKRLRNTINWFLFSLAVADLSVGLTYLPSLACESASFCSKCVTTPVRWLFLNLSMTNLCALTVDRYMAIVTPLKYAKHKAKRRHVFFISAAWILPFILHFVPFAWMYCTRMYTLLNIFYAVVLFAFKLPPYLVLFTVCLRTLYIAHRQKNRYSIRLSQLQFNGFSLNDSKCIRLRSRVTLFSEALGIIVFIFLICYAIDIARLLCFSLKCINYITWDVVYVQRILFICNSASNPFIYGFLKRDIRCELKRLIRRV